jgi:hypothetical protein
MIWMPSLLRFNEGKSCDAVLRHLERRGGATRTGMRFPDREGHAAPVELVCTIGNQLYAIEHTGIEPFQGHMRGNAEDERLIRPIVAGVAGRLPPEEEFELQIPAGAMEGIRGRDVAGVQRHLIDWIVDSAPKLWIPPVARKDTQVKATHVPGVPFPVKLYRLQSRIFKGKLNVVHVVSDVENHRLKRVTIALEKKMPKLAVWKKDAGARTVLVLEENDIQLTNHEVVTKAVLKAEKTLGRAADEIYVVSTSSTPWHVYFVRVDDHSCLDLSDSEEWSWDTDPAQLSSLTGR